LRKNYKICFLVISFFLFSQGSVFAQGFALSFDGSNDLVTFGTVPTVSQHTIEAWVKPESHSSPGIIAGHIAGPDQACSKGMNLNMQPDNLPRYAVDISGCGNATTIDGPAVIVGEWVHIAGTYDGDIMSLYVNGQLVDQMSGIPFDASDWMTAGAVTFFNGDQAFFSGEIDEIRIWNFARTSQEIQDTMNCYLSGTEPGLIGYWKMDEGSGQEVGDSSSAGITGVLGHNSNIESSDPLWVVSQAPIDDCAICECDLNNDGSCNGLDWLLFYPDWGRIDCTGSPDPCECDLNGDGSCNGLDWLLFYPDWGRTDCP
jgi:hypothetical protein